jgi:cytidylate kinase
MTESTARLPSTIAIDGPAGAGKSTVGMRLADRLGYRYYDSGVLYRAVTLLALQRGTPIDDEAALACLAAALDIAFARPESDDGRQHTIMLDGQDVTWALRTKAVNEAVSVVSAHPAVRATLLERQRAVGREGRVVMVGRDIGTVVLPDADLKIYLDATPAERARRRHREQLERGQASDLSAVLQEVLRRDQLDSGRATAPLRPAPDAVRLQTDELDVEAVVDRILAEAQRHGDAVRTTGSDGG